MQFVVALVSAALLAGFAKAQYFEFETFANLYCDGEATGAFECTSPDCDGEFVGEVTYGLGILVSDGCSLYIWSGDYAGEEGYLSSANVYPGECIHFTAGYTIESFEALCA